MSKRENKLGRAAHIKRHTVGTSNEISFSVLDAAKNQLEGDAVKDDLEGSKRFGRIALFTLPLRRKKTVATPTKERGLPLSSGEFASVEDYPSTGSGTRDFGPVKQGTITVSTGTKTGTGNVAPRKTSDTPVGSSSLAVSSAPRRSPEEEIAHRKTKRRRHRILAASLIVVIGLCVAGAGGWYLYQDHQRHMSQIAQLDSSLSLIREVDETVVALDSIVAKPLEKASLETADKVIDQLPEAREKLDEADQSARSVSVDLRESKDKEAANQTVAAIAARKALLDTGEQIVEQAQIADDAASRARDAWQNVITGDALARDAAALVVDTTDEHVSASKEKTNAAAEAFAQAQNAFDELAFEFPDIDFADQRSYVAKRIEAMGYALASDDAFLAKNKEEAVAQNDAYNQSDAEAAALAATLPDDAAEPVLAAFEQATSALRETYSTARSQAGSADAFLRDYLGTPSK